MITNLRNNLRRNRLQSQGLWGGVNKLSISKHIQNLLRKVYDRTNEIDQHAKLLWWTLVLQEVGVVALDVNLSFLIVDLVIIEMTFPSKCTKMSATLIQQCIIEPINKEKGRKIVNKTNKLSSLEANGCSTLLLSQKIKERLDMITEMARKMNFREFHNLDI